MNDNMIPQELAVADATYDSVRVMVLATIESRLGWQLVLRADALVATGIGGHELSPGDERLVNRGDNKRAPVQADLDRAAAAGWDFAGLGPAAQAEMLAEYVQERVLGGWDKRRGWAWVYSAGYMYIPGDADVHPTIGAAHNARPTALKVVETVGRRVL